MEICDASGISKVARLELAAKDPVSKFKLLPCCRNRDGANNRGVKRPSLSAPRSSERKGMAESANRRVRLQDRFILIAFKAWIKSRNKGD